MPYPFPREIEEDFIDVFERGMEKRRRLNAVGEACYLRPDGTVTRDEDKIIAAQRIWRERVYSPPGTLFEKRGKMYKHTLEDWKTKTNMLLN